MKKGLQQREIHLTQAQLRSLQLVQLDMLREVDRVCRENRIQYSLAGGTLLGAVRHKGYIPWDDDADVVLLRTEYDRFAKIFDGFADKEKYYFQDATNTAGYRWGYGKIRRKGTLWMRAGQENMPFNQEICIDVFPLDAVPDGTIGSKLHNFHCFLIRKILWSEVGKQNKVNPLIRTIYGVMNKIPLKVVWNHYCKLVARHNNGDNHRLRVLMFPTPRGYDYEGRTEWYNDFTELEFEGTHFRAMSKYHEYLQLKYGDYMKLPPESERKAHPISKFQLPNEE
jgi:lipopolysaccharide cholinephosphotransferase